MTQCFWNSYKSKRSEYECVKTAQNLGPFYSVNILQHKLASTVS